MVAGDFERNYHGLIASGYRPLGKTQKEEALKQVITYFQNNKDLSVQVSEPKVSRLK
jgi:DNA helicase-2/ATP-dependent DNA helicase PcrA